MQSGSKIFQQEEKVVRQEPCRICGTNEGVKIGEADYWDLQSSSLIYCPSCRLVQLDPMLTQGSTAIGCEAYWLDEIIRTPVKEQERNLVRNFRRGIVFGYDLKRKGFSPGDILEFGPGSGYFAAGVQFVFPACRITVVDIVEDVLNKNRDIHGFEVIHGHPEEIQPLACRKFDLVIARDILEHVTDIGKVISNVAVLLKNKGLFHFLTPNGHEDVWGHWLHWKNHHSSSELLINHVNYFDGKGLKDFLERNDFSRIEYYTYQLKTTLRGKGWKLHPSLEAASSKKKSASQFIVQNGKIIREINFDRKKILDKWYLNTPLRWLTYLYCLYKHHWWIHLDPGRNTGHEISGLFIYNPTNT